MPKASEHKIHYLIIPYNAKIADINEADVLRHFLILANAAGAGAIAGETRKIVSISLRSHRIAGAGQFNVYPNEGANLQNLGITTYYAFDTIIADGTQRLQYSQSVANDDFDLYCYGYVVEA